MKHLFSLLLRRQPRALRPWLLLTALMGAVPAAWAQTPTVTRAGLVPAANARTAPRATTVAVPFSQNINPATAGNIKVFSSQYRGRRTATASTSGSTVTLTPTAASGSASFRPGETVFVTVPATVQSTGGVAAARHVYQFTAAATGGTGMFSGGSNPGVGSSPESVAVGDVDGDGDLDLLAANNGSSTVSVRLNDGSGTFSGGSDPGVGRGPISVAVGDVDGDGDLDLLTANRFDNTVSVWLNNGSGTFSGGSDPGVGNFPGSVAVGDVDGDGDLDFVAANAFSNSVSVRLNQSTAPTLTGFSPTSGPVGTSITLTGTNLTGATAVTFAGSSGNVVSTGFAVASATSITGVVVPAGAITGPLTVTTPQGTSAASPQAFTVTPALSNLVLSAGSLSPAFAGGTTSYTLTVPGTTTSTTLTPTNAQVPGGTIAVNGVPVASGAASGALALSPGDNTLTVAVNPVGAGPATTYTVTVTRTPCVVTALAQGATVQLDASGTASLPAAAVDNGSSSTCGAVTLSVSPSAFTCANRGANTVTLTVTDAFGNSATATATVTVADPLAPGITPPAAVTRNTDPNLCTAAPGAWLGMATATDNCSAVVTSDAPAVFLKGTTTVTWTATDGSGNTATATQLVTVEDHQNPAFATQPGTRNVNTDAGQCSAALVLVLPTASDNCAGATVAGVRRDNLPLTAPFAKGTTVITWTATDGAGNAATYDQSIVVTDREDPVVRTKPAAVQLDASGQATLAVTDVDNGSTDNCTIASRRLSRTTFSCADLASGPVSVTLTVTDNSGNASTGTALVTVTGAVLSPSISVSPASAAPAGTKPTLYLGYGPTSVTFTPAGGTSYAWAPAPNLVPNANGMATFTPAVEGTFTFTVTATSPSGCTATTKVTMVVEDVRCGNGLDKVQVCHGGQVICVASSALNAHLGHGDRLGNCVASRGSAPEAPAAALSAEVGLAVYPNPAGDQATVAFRPVLDGTAQVVIYNALGQRVASLFEGAVSGGQLYALPLHCQNLATGLYECRLLVNGKAEMQRLIIER